MTISGKARADLHLHSNCSDGLYSPRHLIMAAAEAGLSAAALTDHDTMSGIDEAMQTGAACGIETVPGVEISSYENGLEIHLLGYYPAYPDALSVQLSDVRRDRFKRMALMVERLNNLGFSLDPAQIFQKAAPAAPGRLHLARYMVDHMLVDNLEQAFSLYLNRGRPAYLPRTNLTPSAALLLLLESGSVPVIAHPGPDGKKLLPALIKKGLQGVEVYHPDHSTALKRYYHQAAMQNHLLVTGGSDFHGDKQFRVRAPGSVSIPYQYLELLKAKRFG